MLVLTLNSKDDYIMIGNDIKIYLKEPWDRNSSQRTKIVIDAPPHIKILRSNAIKKDHVER